MAGVLTLSSLDQEESTTFNIVLHPTCFLLVCTSDITAAVGKLGLATRPGVKNFTKRNGRRRLADQMPLCTSCRLPAGKLLPPDARWLSTICRAYCHLPKDLATLAQS